MTLRRPVRVFSIVYNDPFLDWFERGCVKSLCWPKNKQALKKAVAFDVWTMPKDAKRVKEIASRTGVPVEVHQLSPYDRPDDEGARKAALLHALTTQMDRCAGNSAFLWVAPDSIFGDGTVPSLMDLGAVPNVCVSLAPMRVREEGFIESMGDGPVGNAALVRLAFERMHRAFAEAEATRPDTNSFISGVSWRRIGEGLYAITHRCHSAYLMQPTREDVTWFRDFRKFGAYDHAFPKRLVAEERQRVIGSSDAAFVAELTADNAHLPKLQQTDPAEPDRYRNQHTLPHYSVNRNVLCIWRAA